MTPSSMSTRLPSLESIGPLRIVYSRKSWPLRGLDVSQSYRSRCRLATGSASQRSRSHCRRAAGAVSPTYRSHSVNYVPEPHISRILLSSPTTRVPHWLQ